MTTLIFVILYILMILTLFLSIEIGWIKIQRFKDEKRVAKVKSKFKLIQRVLILCFSLLLIGFACFEEQFSSSFVISIVIWGNALLMLK